MQRHQSLHCLSSDHNQGLAQARRLRLAGDPAVSMSLREIAEGFLRVWEGGGKAHFRKEEELLLPAYARYADVNTVEIINMLLQHVDLRRRADDLRQALASGELCREQMQEFGRLFTEHIRHEERVVFGMIEEAMPEEALCALGDLMQ